MAGGRVIEYSRNPSEQRRGGIPKCMKPGPDGALSLRDQARRIVLSVSDPREAWSQLKDWASKQSDPSLAMHPALFQVLRHSKDLRFAAIASEVAREAGRMQTSMPAPARENLIKMLTEACSAQGLVLNRYSFTVLSPDGRAFGLPASRSGPLPALTLQPSSIGSVEPGSTGAFSVSPSSDLSQFVMAREAILRVSDRLHDSLTTLDRATLMPDNREMPPSPKDIFTESPFLALSKPFEKPRDPWARPEAAPQESRKETGSVAISKDFAHPPKQPAASQPWIKEEKKPQAAKSRIPTPPVVVQPSQPRTAHSPQPPEFPRAAVLPKPNPAPAIRPPAQWLHESLPTFTQKTPKPEKAEKEKKLPVQQKRRKTIPVAKGKKAETPKAMKAGTGHDLVRALAERLKSHASGGHATAKSHPHHPGHPVPVKGHVHEKRAKSEKRAEARLEKKTKKLTVRKRERKKEKLREKSKKIKKSRKEKSKLRELLKKKRKKNKYRRS